MAKVVKIMNISGGYLTFRNNITLKQGQSITLTVTDEEYRYYTVRRDLYRVKLIKDLNMSDEELKKPRVEEIKQAVDAGVLPVDTKNPETIKAITENFRSSDKSTDDNAADESTSAAETTTADDTDENEKSKKEIQTDDPTVGTDVIKHQFDSLSKRELKDMIINIGAQEDFKQQYGKSINKANKAQLIEFLTKSYNSVIDGK